jgi:hypothetical protein
MQLRQCFLALLKLPRSGAKIIVRAVPMDACKHVEVPSNAPDICVGSLSADGKSPAPLDASLSTRSLEDRTSRRYVTCTTAHMLQHPCRWLPCLLTAAVRRICTT